MKKKLLIVTPYYYPDIAANVNFIKEIVEEIKNDFSISIFANEVRNPQIQKDKTEERNIFIYRCKNKFSKMPGLYSKIIEYIVFYIKCYLFIKNRADNFDIIFCQSTPPYASIPIRLASKKARIIYNVQDIFPDSLMLYLGNRKFTLLHKIEKISYQYSDIIIAISEGFKRKIQERSKNSKIYVIPNWVDSNKIFYKSNAKERLPELNSYFNKDNINIVYSGNIGFGLDFDLILNAAKKMIDKNANFIIIGNGKAKRKLQKKINALKLNNVILLPPFPHDYIADIYSFGDVYILPIKSNLLAGSYPSKTWSILACGSPLVISANKEMEFAKELSESRLAYISNPGDVDDFINKIMIAKRNNRRDSDRIINIIKEIYCKEKLIKQYIYYINSII